jgi:hypothetical protein
MKKLIITAFIFTFGKCYGQSQYAFDTAKVTYEFKKETNKWDYYKSSGTLAWGNVTGFDSTLIPNGGYAVRKYKNITVNGYIVFKKEVSSSWGGKPVYFLDANKKQLQGFFKTIIL